MFRDRVVGNIGVVLPRIEWETLNADRPKVVACHINDKPADS